ncbi:MAG: PhzF family phenazine biosynthesis protein [Bacteroidota bacterium]
MIYKLYQVDAFTNRLFKGNPAAVVPLDQWLSNEELQAIASENNLSETAFTIPKGDDFELRWFTPAAEVRLCGHATLATAYVFFHELNYNRNNIRFYTKSGWLNVRKEGDYLSMDFPADVIVEANHQKIIVQQALNIDAIKALYEGKDDYLVILEDQSAVEKVQPDFRAVAAIEKRGVIVSAKGKETDFVSRCFFPRYGIDEDPVTGSAHTTMTPYWAKMLQKNTLTARQISKRSGDLICSFQKDRVLLKGQAKLYMKGEIYIDQ